MMTDKKKYTIAEIEEITKKVILENCEAFNLLLQSGVEKEEIQKTFIKEVVMNFDEKRTFTAKDLLVGINSGRMKLIQEAKEGKIQMFSVSDEDIDVFWSEL